MYKLDLGELENDLEQAKGDYSQLLAEPKYRFLMLDTAHFEEAFKADLLATIEDLDEQCDGLLVHSENFQALNLLQERYREQVKCIYIDPPYNTGGDGFAYKDQYQHSSWLTMITERLRAAYPLLQESGVLFSSIDGIERDQLVQSLGLVFGKENRVEEVIWAQNTTKNKSPTYSTNHEYVEVFAKSKSVVSSEFMAFREGKPGFKEIMELLDSLLPDYPPCSVVEAELKALYKRHKKEIIDETSSGDEAIDEWKGIYNYNRVEYRDSNGCYVDEAGAKELNAKLWVWREVDTSMPQVKEDSQKPEFKDPADPAYRFYQPRHPVTGKPCPAPKRGWAWPLEPLGKQKSCFTVLADDERIAWGADEEKIPQRKSFLHEVESNVAKSVVVDYTDGEKELAHVFGRSRVFGGPKPTTLIQRLVQHANCQDNDVICDFYAGSGTTGQAVFNLNHGDGGCRKMLLVEMGGHFHTTLLPREYLIN